MSQVQLKFLAPIPAPAPVNAVIATGDTVIGALNKLQGQLNQQAAGGVAVRQIYNGGSEPAAVPGYTLLWFEPTGGADPDDRFLHLI